jgi:hypothetical protein
MPRHGRATRPKLRQLGKQPPRYRFFLNPYTDARFTSCPQCGNKTRVRKLPLVIHVDQGHTLVLNKTCKFCPFCDLLIAHQDEIEAFLAAYFSQNQPEVVGNDYLVLGTEDRADWKRGMHQQRTSQEALESLHDFRDYVTFTPAPRWEWVPPPSPPGSPDEPET